jgi:hypothetical protein
MFKDFSIFPTKSFAETRKAKATATVASIL